MWGVFILYKKDRRHTNASTMDRTSDAYDYGGIDTDSSYPHPLAYGNRC